MISQPDIRGLLLFALESLKQMQLGSGLFCLEKRQGDRVLHGQSTRYSAIAYIGLLKANAHGYPHKFDLDEIHDALFASKLEGLYPGDVGLLLWADALTGYRNADELLPLLERRLEAKGGLGSCDGMEVAWIAQGLALHVQGHESTEARSLLQQSVDVLVLRGATESGLFYDSDRGRLRRRFPNFATQIYPILALATAAKAGLDKRALQAARRGGDALLALQMPDGAWPWLFDVKTGRIVEPYEIHSVHQDSMAPMGLLQLAEAADEPKYADAAIRGLRWTFGENELSQDMVSKEDGLVYRSIRRRKPWNQMFRLANVATSGVFGSPLAPGPRVIELNRTGRPYHFGWMLEAWCGREHLLPEVPDTSGSLRPEQQHEVHRLQSPNSESAPKPRQGG